MPNESGPSTFSRRHHYISEDNLRAIETALRDNYFGAQEAYFGPVNEYLATASGADDLEHHLTGRLAKDRATVVPWLSAQRALDGMRILEVGCGTGASTVALAEQGSVVTGIDIDEGALRVAELRIKIAGTKTRARFLAANATDMTALARQGEYDCIAFFASLQHMTHSERMVALADAWALLPSGGLLVTIEAPNRLWYFDEHSSFDSFFHWLPDELALQWARRSPRSRYRRLFDGSAASITDLARHGRGVSFHDYTVALDIEPSDLPASESLEAFLGSGRFSRATPEGRYLRFIHEQAPGVAEAFFYPYLDFALRKP